MRELFCRVILRSSFKWNYKSKQFSNLSSQTAKFASSPVKKMSQNTPLILRLLASSVNVASRAGKIVKDVMSKGDLGIVEKVRFFSKFL